MNTTKSRRLRALENLPVSLELVQYPDVEKIPIAEIAEKHGMSTPRVVSLIGALIRSPEAWTRLADQYGLTDEQRPRWVGAGSTASTLPPPLHHTPVSYMLETGQVDARSHVRWHAAW